MKKIRILFYVTPKKFKWKYKINWLISLWTRSKYSHCEVWTPDESGRGNPDFQEQNQWMYPHPVEIDPSTGFDIMLDKPMGICYTSTMRGDHNGTVKRPASEVLDKPSHWEYIEIKLTGEQYDHIVSVMDIEVTNNMGYSKWDLLKFVSPWHFPDESRNICSEFVNNMLYFTNVFTDGFGIISPKKLHKKLTKLGYETKRLA